MTYHFPRLRTGALAGLLALGIEVVYDNDKTPRPRVRFDPQGRFQRSSR